MSGLSKVGTQKNLAKISVIFVEDKQSIRSAIRNVLAHEGLLKTKDFTRLDPLRSVMASELPDLIILDVELEDRMGDAISMIKDIRYGRIGKNPYVPIIATMWSAESDLIRRVVDAGADDILLKPFSPGALMDRIKALITMRKNFIVTSDYIGPDRRKDVARDSQIKSVEVPNTFAAKVQGKEISQMELSQAIRNVNSQVNEMKMQRNAFQISFVAEMLIPKLDAGDMGKETMELIRRMHQVALDTSTRLVGTAYEHVSELCETLTKVSISLLASEGNPSTKDMKLVKPVSDAILLAFNPETDAEALASQISGAVDSYHSRVEEKKNKKKLVEAEQKIKEIATE